MEADHIEPSFRGYRVGLGTLASALLLTAAHPPLGLGILAPVALVPWLCTVGRNVPVGMLSGAALGLLFGMLIGSWIPEALAVRGAGAVSAHVGWLTTALWAGALPWMLLGLAASLLGFLPVLPRAVLGGVLLFGLDLSRSLFVLGVPWALLGHTQSAVLGVAQLAAIGGVPLISGYLFACNLAAADSVRLGRSQSTPGRACTLALLGGWGGLALLGLPTAELAHERTWATAPAESTRLLAVRRPVRYSERWIPEIQETQLERLSYQTERALAQIDGPPPALIVWPENAITTPLAEAPELEATLRETIARLDIDVLLGTIERDAGPKDPRYRSNMLWLSPESGERDRFAKTIGVPVIEVAPSSPTEALLRRLFGISRRNRELVVETEERPLRGPFDLAVGLCYEIVYPQRIASRRTADTRAIVNASSDAWLRDPRTVSSQLGAYGLFRAIEQRLPLVRIADAGESTSLDRFGRSQASIPAGQPGFALVEARPSSGPEPLEQAALGLLLVIAASATALLARIRFEDPPEPEPHRRFGRR